MLINEALYGREALLGRLRQMSYPGAGGSGADLAFDFAGASAIAAGASTSGPTFWAQGLAAWGDIGGNGNASDVSGNFGGIIGGADISTGGDWNFGLAFGYSHSTTDIDGVASSAEVQTGLIGGYAGTGIGAVKLRAGGLYGLNFVDSSRSISFPGYTDKVDADYRAGTGQLFGEIAYSATSQGIALEPFAGLAWVHLNTQDFNESGGAAAELKGSSSASDVGYSSLGLRVATSHEIMGGMILRPRVSVAWQHAFGDLTPAAALAFAGTTGAEFTVSGVPLASDAALIDVGADLQVSRNATLGISYFGQYAADAQATAVQGSFTWAF